MKTKIIMLCLLFTAFTISCKKELDFKPYGKVPPAEFWKTAADGEKAVFACYAAIVTWDFFDVSRFCTEDIASGNTVKGGEAGTNLLFTEFENFTFSSSNTFLPYFWNGRYSVINLANQAIANIPNIEMDETAKKMLLAEAHFMRGWMYFDLARTFGEVPVFDGLPADANYNIPKSPLSDVYKLITSDFEYTALNGRPTPWPLDMKGRITAKAGLAALAKAKMYMASGEYFTEEKQPINGTTWVDVKKVTDEVIASNFYKLFDLRGDSSFFYQFRIQYENNDESIFEAQCGTSSTSWGLARSYYAQRQWAFNLGGYGFNAPSDAFITDWELRTDDTLRYRQSIAYQGTKLPFDKDIVRTMYQENTSAKGLVYKTGDVIPPGYKKGDDVPVTGLARSRYNFKAYEARKDDKNNGGWQRLVEQNWKILRYADILLIDAEAEFRLGNLADAVTSINLVRNRVKATPYTEANLTLDKILDERRFELAFEDDSFRDMVRSGRAEAKMGPRGFNKNKNSFYPIPQLQIDLSNGALVQNKYW